MKIYKHRIFAKWAKSEKLSDATLKKAIQELESGLFDANLGGGIYKKRVARQGQGKRDGYRTLIAFKHDDKAIFVFGFAKNIQANIANNELESFKSLANNYLHFSKVEISEAVKAGKLIEVI